MSYQGDVGSTWKIYKNVESLGICIDRTMTLEDRGVFLVFYRINEKMQKS